MDYSRIGKIEKAKRYAEERHRIQFQEFTVTMKGDNDTHTIAFKDGKFHSDGPFFQAHGFSSHTIALERILQGMIPSPAQSDSNLLNVHESTYISKIEKAKRYADERNKRIEFQTFTVTVQGDNSTHTLSFKDGKFYCDDPYFQTHGYSAHTMTMERVLEGMMPSPAHLEV